MAKKPVLRCGDCLQFEHAKDRCAWGIPECKGKDHPFAQECANYTDQNGYAPLLDCDEDQLPAWYRQKELLPYEGKAIPAKPVAASDIKKKSRKRKRKQQAEQLEVLSYAIAADN